MTERMRNACQMIRDAMEFIVNERGLTWRQKRDAVAADMSENAGSEWAEFMGWFGAEVDE